MTDARIVVEPNSTRLGHKGPVTGVVWLAIGDTAFPSRDWHDFVVVVLEWWTYAVLQLLRGISKHEVIHFMEGPYLVELSIGAGQAWSVDLFETGQHVGRWDIAPRVLVQSLLSASESVLETCRRETMWSNDAEKLATSMSSLKDELPA
jgi:hypothetical protein